MADQDATPDQGGQRRPYYVLKEQRESRAGLPTLTLAGVVEAHSREQAVREVHKRLHGDDLKARATYRAVAAMYFDPPLSMGPRYDPEVVLTKGEPLSAKSINAAALKAHQPAEPSPGPTQAPSPPAGDTPAEEEQEPELPGADEGE